jgi:hypothetical protein
MTVRAQTQKASSESSMDDIVMGAPSAASTANCIIIDHFSAFEPGLVAHFLTLPLKNGWQWVKTARNLNIGVSRNRCCDFLADPDSRSFSRFGAIIMQFAVVVEMGLL